MTEHLENLTSERLRQLYVDEGRTEKEIARMYGTYQVKVGRLRRSYAIPTVAKSDRLGLPDELPVRLRSILIGSMLGDGRLFATSTTTAAYSEYHSDKQASYLDWKMSEWGPFALRCSPSQKGQHQGRIFTTHGCRVLRPFWKLLYPKGRGAKTFVDIPVEWVDGLALAVWFMDNGSKKGRHMRFHVSPNKADRKAQMKMLRALGMRARDFEEVDNTLLITSRSFVSSFKELVRPHLHPSMAYKLEAEPTRVGLAPRELLTTERLQPLVDRGFSAQKIADVFQVSRGSVARVLERMGVPRRSAGRPKKGTSQELDIESAGVAIKQLDYEAPDYKEAVLKILIQTELPAVIPTREQAIQDWARIKAAPTEIENNTFVKVSYGGSRVCQRFFIHRWDARYRDRPSVRESWYEPKHLKRAIQFQVGVGDPVTPVRVFRSLQAVVRGPTNFRASFAKAIVEALSPEGGTVLDPCAGYGGRAVGTLAAGRKYVGVDPHPKAGEAFQGLQTIVGELGFYNEPFEDVDLGDLKADLVFTSPPYFSVERYSEDETQSWVRYRTWEAWVNGFLSPLVTKARAHLKDGGRFCINTKNVKIGGQEFPIVDELVRLAQEAGFKLERTLELPLGRLGKVVKTEPVFVFA